MLFPAHAGMTPGVLGAALARFRPHGMALATLGTALALAAIAVVALLIGLGPPQNGPVEMIGGHGLFVALYALASGLFFRVTKAEQGATAE